MAAVRRELLTQVHVSFCFFLIFIAYSALEILQSSLNFESGLGTISISLVYVGYLLSSLLIGPSVVSVLSPKWAMFVAFFSHTLFIVANIWPGWWTLPPASFLLGVAAGPYWIAQGTYATVLSVVYAEQTRSDLDHVAAKFSGIFHLLWGAAKPIGNSITSFVLGWSEDVLKTQQNCTLPIAFTNSTDLYTTNYTNYTLLLHPEVSLCPNETAKLGYCGPDHCPYMESHQGTLEKPDSTLIYILLGIFLVFNLLGISITGLLSNVQATKSAGVCDRILSVVHITAEADVLLLIIPCCLIGIIPGTMYATFAQSTISCIFGIDMVGYAMMFEGAGFCLASILCGPLVHLVPRPTQVLLTLVVFTSFPVWFSMWYPEQFWVVCVVTSLYGLMHGTYRTHVAGLVCLIYPQNPESAFAHYNIWVGVGFTASFAYTNFLCYDVKMYLMTGVAFAALIAYTVLEIRLYRDKRKKKALVLRTLHESTLKSCL